MLNWQDVNDYENAGKGLLFNDEPEVLLWHRTTGAVVGKLMKFPDGEVMFIAPGYHGFKFVKFANINMPEVE